MENVMEKIVSLCKRRGFIFPGSEIYGGLANSWDYGPYGVELKNNIKTAWWKRYVHRRDDIVGIDAALIMNPKVWQASGHLRNFVDPLVECKVCHTRYRLDQMKGISDFSNEKIKEDETATDYKMEYKVDPNFKCPNCDKNDFAPAQMFNLMFKTYIGPSEETSNIAYFRPETAQAMFVNFKQILTTMRNTLPFGIAQIGKVFRNEITPGNFIFRTREFEQMEIEYFIPKPIHEQDWQTFFEFWRQEMHAWMKDELGLNPSHIHELEVSEKERAHYSKRTIDFEYDYPFGRKELYGLAYRTDFDLANHEKYSGQNLTYTDPTSGEKYWPHVIEPTWGVDRSVLAVLVDSYREKGEGPKARIYLSLKPSLAPVKIAVFPLLRNKEELVLKAREVYKKLKARFVVAWDDRGNIGKRYMAQDEIGTPWCVTIDYDTLKDDTITVRDRDTMIQKRIKIEKLIEYFDEKLS